MAKQFYQLIGGTNIVVWDDPQDLTTQAELQAQVDALLPFQGLSDGARTLLAQGGVPGAGIPGGFPDLASFDTFLTDEIERLQDIVDYYDYDSKQETISSVRDGAWYVPEAIEAFSDETVGNEASLSIDGNNATGWQPATEPASITYRVRTHRKNFEGIRLWIPNNTLKTELQGLTIRASQALGMIDDPANVMATGLDLSYSGTAMQEILFGSKKRARYLKLDIDGSNHAQNQILVRTIEVRVGVFNHDK